MAACPFAPLGSGEPISSQSTEPPVFRELGLFYPHVECKLLREHLYNYLPHG